MEKAVLFYAQQAPSRGGATDLMRLVQKVAMEAGVPIRLKEIAPRLSNKQRKTIDSAAVTIAMKALVELGVGETERGARDALLYRATELLP